MFQWNEELNQLMHMGWSCDHPCACEQQVGKKRKKTGRQNIRKEYEVRKEGKWARKKESRRPSYAGVPGCRKYPAMR